MPDRGDGLGDAQPMRRPDVLITVSSIGKHAFSPTGVNCVCVYMYVCVCAVWACKDPTSGENFVFLIT